ncbi:GtrA family protein [Janibacter sp. G1551]|uniref:GtrA family protein n=1 Tax=Janibacter sp. G1551 TaxID=3420440 RepID=UPI003D07CF10
MPIPPATSFPSRVLQRARDMMGTFYRELIKFGLVGAVAFVVDLGTFNLLSHAVFAGDKPTTATILSTSIATVVAWLGNRYWTFRRRRNRPPHHELALFFGTNGVALLLSAFTVAFSHYVLGYATLVGDNIAKVVGIVLGTAFRFWAYRTLVFAHEPAEDEAPHGG